MSTDFQIDVNWDIVKFKYEVMHRSLEELAAEYSLSLKVLQFTASSWQRIPLAKDISVQFDDSALSDVTTLTDALKAKVENKTQVFSVLKQKFLAKKYTELETILLYKAIDIATSISSTDPAAARTVRSLTETLKELLDMNPLLKPQVEDIVGDKDTVWTVNVVSEQKTAKEDK